MPATTPQVKSLTCPNCGSGVQIRGYAATLNVVCISCLSILDASTPELRILQKFQERTRYVALIPLGSRGKLFGDTWEAIGFQVRQFVVDGTPYEWEEYLLFNPFKGYRYITQYQGHWNFVKTLQMLPEGTSVSGRPAMKLLGETYKHFQTAVGAATIYVMGEFPWQVRVGDKVTVQDFIAPPRMLSSEITENEVTWSLGEYTDGALIYQAFGIKEAPPAPQGVFANQPAPKNEGSGSAWGTWMILNILLFAMMFAFSVMSRNEVVLNQQYVFVPGLKTEASFVTEPFDLKGRTSNVEVELRTNLRNNSAYFNLALINEATGQAYDFGREVSFYNGSDSDGAWSEGKPGDEVLIPSVPPGRYYMRVEPEMDLSETTTPPPGSVRYSIQLRRDVPSNLLFWLAALLLLIPPVLKSLGGKGFEAKRWQESDYAE